MASSSPSFASSSQHPQWEYDVFLSFRGEDTRKIFTGHLYEGLRIRGIHTFQDDRRLEHGKSISEELQKAIEKSQVALIIFSKNYASSTWCLDELVQIMERNKINRCGKTLVIPIFYHVDPSTVRKQKKTFAEALEEHESGFKANDDVEGMEKVQRWRTALTAAANLKGYDICEGIESKYIKQIVDQVSTICKTSLHYLQDVVGIHFDLEKVESLLNTEINDVRIVGIWGMGGIGKTTLARAIFDRVSYQFEAVCFLPDIKENRHGMHFLQNILLSKLLGEKANVDDNEEGKKMMARRLCFKKVLVVLDDIDDIDHLENLGDRRWFGSGSRIIITTRDRHLIGKNDVVYEMTTLVHHEALQLFNQYAFKEEVPDKPFEELTLEVINYAKGLPLALKVWGSLLYNRNIAEWRSAIADMKKNSNSKIVDKLIISYNRLEPTQQKMFLDLACFLRGEDRDESKQILESCDFEVDFVLCVLIDRSLVSISENDTIEMHDLIQNMGKYVVNMQKDPGESISFSKKDPGERSILWLTEDFKEVMENNTGTEAMEAIWLPYDESCLSTEAIKDMRKLRILNIDASWMPPLKGSIEYLSNNLRWLVWENYPWKSLPANFEPKKIVHLQLRNNFLRQLWTGGKHLPYLRTLDLSNSNRLKQTPDFTGMSNLEYLNLECCRYLEEISNSLGCCRKLIKLNVSKCSKLERLPEEVGNLVNLEVLDATCTAISRLPSSIFHLDKLKVFFVKSKINSRSRR